jgi:hypothetical protein
MIQFPIQFVITTTNHCSQNLSLDELVFDLVNVLKHGLTYTINQKKKKKINGSFPTLKLFYGSKVDIKMKILKTITTWIPFIVQFIKKLISFSCKIYTFFECNIFMPTS